MIGAIRRRLMDGESFATNEIVLPDHIRLIVKGQGDKEVQFISASAYDYYIERVCDSMYIDNELLSTPVSSIKFNDTNWHDIYYRTTGNFLHTLPRMVFSWYPARVIDIPSMYSLHPDAAQTFKIKGVGSNVPYSIFNFIFRSSSIMGIEPTNTNNLITWGWDKNSVNLYVPSSLVQDYSVYCGGANNYAIYARANILSLEQSQFNKRLPIEQLNLD